MHDLEMMDRNTWDIKMTNYNKNHHKLFLGT